MRHAHVGIVARWEPQRDAVIDDCHTQLFVSAGTEEGNSVPAFSMHAVRPDWVSTGQCWRRL